MNNNNYTYTRRLLLFNATHLNIVIIVYRHILLKTLINVN